MLAKNVVHESFKRGWSIHGSKRHYEKLAMSIMGSEIRFVNVLLLHSYLMVTKFKVQFGEYSYTVQFIK